MRVFSFFICITEKFTNLYGCKFQHNCFLDYAQILFYFTLIITVK